MKIIVFVDIPMKVGLKAVSYKNTGNAMCNCDKKVIFPINAVLHDSVKKGDEVKIVLLAIKGEAVEKNIESFKNEFSTVNGDIGAKVYYEVLLSEFDESKSNYQKRFRQMIGCLFDGGKIFSDITFGPKPLAVLLLCVVTFAQKFFDCDIARVIYGKIRFDKENRVIEGTQEIFDVTSLYYLSNMVNLIEAPNEKVAKKMIDEFFLTDL